ncbi:hypothetical protein RhiirA5_440311 [Rhizophagus irregularis]|uniref:Uncharacterized protein n=1 Tax=Rhizophagus irregularis TaxID=588596 RepID=A0A2N0NGS4_9GLOM|nr:hypothetical protein RhiirA5_440311 [Rhizophagus irregularis]PKC55163.1 hypothetical protein RhiirA1_476071 [Rhizophagus irregularis]
MDLKTVYELENQKDVISVEENISIEATIDTGADVNYISQKHIGELGITYHNKRKTLFDLITIYNHAGSRSYNTVIGPGHIVPVITKEDVKRLELKITQM